MALPKLSEDIESLLLCPEFTEFLRLDGYLDDVLFLKRILDYVAYYNAIAAQFPANSLSPIPSPQTSLPLTKTTSFRVFSQLHSYAKVILVHYCLPSQELASAQAPPRLSLLKEPNHFSQFTHHLILTRAKTKELDLHSAIFKLSEQLTQPGSTDPFQSFHPSIFIPTFDIVQDFIQETVLPSFDLRLIQNLSLKASFFFSFLGFIFLGLCISWLIYFTNPRMAMYISYNGKYYGLYFVFFLLFFTATFLFRQAYMRFSYLKSTPTDRKEILNTRANKYRKKAASQQIKFSLMLSSLVTLSSLFAFSAFTMSVRK